MLRVELNRLSIAIVLLFVFFTAENVIAANAPNLISPSDNSNTDKTPKLSWQYNGECPASGSCFRIEVDNTSDFSSPDKSSYTNSSSYSPQGLPEGEYYWRVKARDPSNKWSEWSSIFKFNSGSINTSSPTPSSENKSSPASNNQSGQKAQSGFRISDLPQEINSDKEFEAVVIVVSPSNSNQNFYLKGAFKKSDSSNYFGETFSGEWVKNGTTYSKQFKITTNAEGKWEGKIKVKPDQEDSGFDGTGEYIFKIARYSDSGSGPVWSNEISIKINEVSSPEISENNEEEAPEEIEEDEEVVIKKAAAPSRAYEIKIASVAGEATMSNNITLEEQTRVLEEKRVNWLLVFLGIGIVIGGAGYTFFRIKRIDLFRRK